jgi:hypothetical protein
MKLRLALDDEQTNLLNHSDEQLRRESLQPFRHRSVLTQIELPPKNCSKSCKVSKKKSESGNC